MPRPMSQLRHPEDVRRELRTARRNGDAKAVELAEELREIDEANRLRLNHMRKPGVAAAMFAMTTEQRTAEWARVGL